MLNLFLEALYFSIIANEFYIVLFHNFKKCSTKQSYIVIIILKIIKKKKKEKVFLIKFNF